MRIAFAFDCLEPLVSHLRPSLVLLVLAILAATSGCTELTFISSDVAYNYQTETPAGPVHRGWNRTWVGRSLEHPWLIVHKIEIQQDLAGNLVRMSSRELRKIVGQRVCPSLDSPVWEHLQKGQDILVEMATHKRRLTPFATISCRSALR